MEIIIKIQIDGVEKKDVKVNTEINEEVIDKEDKIEDHGLSIYARWFDDGCVGWTKDPEYNLAFLEAQQKYANNMLQTRGHIFLNEIYDLLGIPRTKAGAVMGWVDDKDHPGDINYVDFGLYSERNRDFINGFENTVLLDFNVNGNILDLI